MKLLFICFCIVSIIIPCIICDIDPHFENPILHAKKFEGDIDGIENAPTSQPAVNVWPGGVIPFSVDGTLDAATLDMLFKAISSFKQKTCVKLVPAKPKHKYSIHFKKGLPGEGCYTKVGRQGGKQNVVLEIDCAGVGTILHLLMHVLGFYHENARIDRDNYVNIIWSNIAENNKKNFGKYIVPYHGQDYDYQSITHLPKEAFAKDRKRPTMTNKNGEQLPDYVGLSDGDVAKVNYRYCQGWELNDPMEREGLEFQNDGGCPRCRRSLSSAKDKKKDRDRRRGTAADRHHERHGHGHGAGGHGHRGQHGKDKTN